MSLCLPKGAGPAPSESVRAGSRDPAPLAPEESGPSGWFDLDDPACPGHRGPPAGAAQFQQAFRPSTCGRLELASLASFLGSSLARSGYPAAAIKHLELAARLSSDEAKRVAQHLHNLRANPAVSLWEKNPYRLSPAPDRPPKPSANHLSRRWAGPKKGTGHRRQRPSSCWGRGRGRGSLPTAIAGCVACGSGITKGLLPRCGDRSPAPSPRPTRSIWKHSVRRSNPLRGTTLWISID